MSALMTRHTPIKPAPVRYELSVAGMTCGGCIRSVETALGAVPGVIRAEADLVTRRAIVEAEPDVNLTALSEALAKKGYATDAQELTFAIDGMHCGSCVARVEEATLSVPGVQSATANLTTSTLTVTVLDGATVRSGIPAALERIGYRADPVAPEAPPKANETSGAARAAAIAAALSFPVFATEMGGHLVPAFHHWLLGTIGQTPLWVFQALLTTLVMIGPGRGFYEKGIPALARGAPDMNTLVAVGTLAAWGFSMVVLLAPTLIPPDARFVYFEAAAVIVTLILAGRWLEARARGQTGAAIRALMARQPQTVRLANGRDVPVASLALDDLIVARPGEAFAVDGIVTDGEGYVDEAAITGEAAPVAKRPGDPVTSGTLNGTAALTYKATATGQNTVLAQIIALVARAQSTRLPVQDLVNRIAAWFVPAVLAIAAATVLIWLVFGPAPSVANALVAGVSVLIIACPCAMGLAVPTSIVVGSGRAAELGVLFRQGAALQQLAGVQTVAFDKTGTLTSGRPELAELTTHGMSETDALCMIASVESASEHPVAGAVLRAAAEAGIDVIAVQDAQAVPGLGISAKVDGESVVVGTKAHMMSLGIETEPLDLPAARLRDAARAPIFAAREGTVFAVFAVVDQARPEAASTVASLQSSGIDVVMLTGDAPEVAQALGRDLGISDIRAGLRPDDKHAAVAALRENRGVVAFVGDGINDAPALAAADIGIAIGTGTNIAIEAADVVLRSGDLNGVSSAFRISKRTMANIHQNLFWAFGYNVALIPVAAGMLTLFGGPMLSPILAAGAMAVSSVLVLTNALRLRFVSKGAGA